MKTRIIFLSLAAMVFFFTFCCKKNAMEPPPPESNLTPSQIHRIDYKDGRFYVYWSRNNEPDFESYVLLQSPVSGGVSWQVIYTSSNRNDTVFSVPDIPWEVYRYYRVNTRDVNSLFTYGPEKRGSSYPRIAFQTNRDGNHEIYIMEIDGSNPVNLTNHPLYDGDPIFTPDGSQILYCSSRDGNPDIYIINIDGSKPKNLTNSAERESDPVITTDGSKIFFEREGNIFSINADGSNEQHLTNINLVSIGFYEYIYGFPNVSPDGQKIVFQGITRLGWWDVFIMNTDGTDLRQLTFSKDNYYPKFSPDGSKIIFESAVIDDYDICTMNTDGSDKIRLTEENGIWGKQPEYSPDGQKIVFISSYTNNYDIYIMDSDGENHIQLTVSPFHEWEPIFSPDNQRIIFIRGEYGYNEIYIMNADGGNQMNITNFPDNNKSQVVQPRAEVSVNN